MHFQTPRLQLAQLEYVFHDLRHVLHGAADAMQSVIDLRRI